MEEEADDRLRLPWRRGEAVRVVSGPFIGLSVKIDDVVGVYDTRGVKHLKLRVLLSIFGRETPVNVDFTNVESA